MTCPCARSASGRCRSTFDIADTAYTGDGVMFNSRDLDGLARRGARAIIAQFVERARRRQVNFRLRDWGISRQRYGVARSR